MKKLFLCAAIAVFGFTMNAQDDATSSQTSKGKWLIEANTGFSAGSSELGLIQHTANTGFGFVSVDGMTIWSLGSEVGYFVMDNLAVKAGLGYTDYDGASVFSYKIGAKYYVMDKIPLQVDLNGASGDDLFGDETPLWLGLQGGYAWFVAPNVSIEPNLRYSLSMNEDFTDEGLFEIRIGFALHF